jgi:hypothetical protein
VRFDPVAALGISSGQVLRVASTVAVQAQINDQTVSVLLDSVRSLLSEQEDRANSLSVRAGGITGFAGIILTLTGVAAKSGHTLEGSLRGAVAAMSVGALVFLALAVVVAVFGVLVPSSAVSISTAEGRAVCNLGVHHPAAGDGSGEIMRGLIASLSDERAQNQAKAVALRIAYFWRSSRRASTALDQETQARRAKTGRNLTRSKRADRQTT